MPLSDDLLARRAAGLEWLLFDVDGVLTDGRLLYGALGELWKVFHVRDGLGLRLAREAGLKTGLLSGRANEAVTFRAAELSFDAVILDRSDKDQAFAELLAAQGTSPERVAYVGDDLLDLPILTRCGLSFAPADAMPDVRERVDRVLTLPGGAGAAREMVEVVLRARGDWDRLVSRYFL